MLWQGKASARNSKGKNGRFIPSFMSVLSLYMVLLSSFRYVVLMWFARNVIQIARESCPDLCRLSATWLFDQMKCCLFLIKIFCIFHRLKSWCIFDLRQPYCVKTYFNHNLTKDLNLSSSGCMKVSKDLKLPLLRLYMCHRPAQGKISRE